MKYFFAISLIIIAALGYIIVAHDGRRLVIAGHYDQAVLAVTEKAVPGLVRLGRGQSLFGHGFVIDRDSGLVATAGHWFGRLVNEPLTIETSAKKHYKAEMILYDKKNDLALIRARTRGEVPAIALFTGPLADLDQVVTLRFNQDFTVQANPGRLTHQVYRDPDCHPRPPVGYCLLNQVEYSGENHFGGYSGGPVVNMQGELVGLHVAQHTRDPKMGLGLPTSENNQGPGQSSELNVPKGVV